MQKCAARMQKWVRVRAPRRAAHESEARRRSRDARPAQARAARTRPRQPRHGLATAPLNPRRERNRTACRRALAQPHLHAGVLGPGNAAVAPLEQDGLQVGPLDDAGVRHVAHLRWRHQVELGVPLVAHAVLDAVGAVARPRREALNLVVHRAVHVAQVLHRVGRQLDRAAKPLELGRPLDHSHVDWRPRAPQRICR
eukprot:7066487-Prymnesium_polylepis.1